MWFITACSGDTGGDVGILTYLDQLILLSAEGRSFKRFHAVSGATVAVIVVFWPFLQIDIGTWAREVLSELTVLASGLTMRERTTDSDWQQFKIDLLHVIYCTKIANAHLQNHASH